MAHGLRGIARISVQPGPGQRPLVVCICGEVSGPVAGETWTVTDNGDDTIALAPSIDWPGHFHEVFARAPLIDDPFRDLIDTPIPPPLEGGSAESRPTADPPPAP